MPDKEREKHLKGGRAWRHRVTTAAPAATVEAIDTHAGAANRMVNGIGASNGSGNGHRNGVVVANGTVNMATNRNHVGDGTANRHANGTHTGATPSPGLNAAAQEFHPRETVKVSRVIASNTRRPSSNSPLDERPVSWELVEERLQRTKLRPEKHYERLFKIGVSPYFLRGVYITARPNHWNSLWTPAYCNGPPRDPIPIGSRTYREWYTDSKSDSVKHLYQDYVQEQQESWGDLFYTYPEGSQYYYSENVQEGPSGLTEQAQYGAPAHPPNGASSYTAANGNSLGGFNGHSTYATANSGPPGGINGHSGSYQAPPVVPRGGLYNRPGELIWSSHPNAASTYAAANGGPPVDPLAGMNGNCEN